MTALRTAAQQALEFLDAEFGWSPGEAPRIDALRAALAQREEPVLVQGELPPRYVARSPIQAEPLNLTDPAVQKRLAAQWGYVHEAQQAEPVEPVATLTAQRDALLEALRMFVSCAIPVSTKIDERGYGWTQAYLDQALPKARAAIKAAEGEKT